VRAAAVGEAAPDRLLDRLACLDVLRAAVLQPSGGMAPRGRVLSVVEGGEPAGWTAPFLSTGNCPSKEGRTAPGIQPQG
jgi:hypothetical protein